MILPMLLAALACTGAPSETDPTETDTADTSDTSDTDGAGGDVVTLTTTLGAIEIALDTEAAPVTTANFLAYVDAGFYDGDDGQGATLFHRVIPDFMAQGGGVLASGTMKTTLAPIANESDNGLSNLRGTVAMARTNDPNSATSQFFINVVDNDFLNVDGAYPPGYAVFGTVTAGMDVVDAITLVPRNRDDRPNEDVVISDCERK
jgi:peptidyl-prolyl cis-trans isomerase B (cyclophilin B)